MSDGAVPFRWISHDVGEVVPGIAMEPAVKSCPHCGCDVYHVRIQVTGTIREHHAFDGRPVDNTDMWNGIRNRQRPTVYCSDCEKPIAKALG